MQLIFNAGTFSANSINCLGETTTVTRSCRTRKSARAGTRSSGLRGHAFTPPSPLQLLLLPPPSLLLLLCIG